MLVAFTGSAQQLTQAQEHEIDRRIATLDPGTIVVTGGCIGVDAFVARAATQRGMIVITILPKNKSKVDADWWKYCHTFEDNGLEYRERNTRMVQLATQLVIGYPETQTNGTDIGSGTWMTLRIAQKAHRQVEIYLLDGIT